MVHCNGELQILFRVGALPTTSAPGVKSNWKCPVSLQHRLKEANCLTNRGSLSLARSHILDLTSSLLRGLFGSPEIVRANSGLSMSTLQRHEINKTFWLNWSKIRYQKFNINWMKDQSNSILVCTYMYPQAFTIVNRLTSPVASGHCMKILNNSTSITGTCGSLDSINNAPLLSPFSPQLQHLQMNCIV